MLISEGQIYIYVYLAVRRKRLKSQTIHDYVHKNFDNSINQSSFIHGITSPKMLFQWAVYIANLKKNYSNAKNIPIYWENYPPIN